MEEGTTGRWVDRGLQSQIPMGRASGFEAGGAAIAHSLRPSKPFLSHLCLVPLSSSTQTEGHLSTDDKRNNKSKMLIREMGLQERGTARDPSTGRMRRQQGRKFESSLSHRARTRPARLSSKLCFRRTKQKSGVVRWLKATALATKP